MTVSDSDDDCPPPLSSIEGQVCAARAGASRSDERAVTSEEIVATVTAAKTSGPRQHAASSSSLRRGFFDAKPSTTRRKPKPPSTGASSSSAARDEMPTLVAKQGKPGIPDWLRVDTSAEQEAYQGLKNQLVEALKPNAETMNGIMQDPQLLAGFDDPEVMAAVNDIAQNPQSFKKHAGNPKVAKFYAAMGQMMGERLEQKAAEKGS